MLRGGLIRLIDQQKDLICCGEAGTVAEAQTAVARRGQPAERHREEQDEKETDPIHGERDPEVRDAERESIGYAARSSRAEYAERDADERREEHRGAGEL